jgi:hypothetical protein
MVFLLAFLIMALVVAGMAIGAMAGRGPSERLLRGPVGGRHRRALRDLRRRPRALRNTRQEHGAEASRADFYDAGGRQGRTRLRAGPVRG